MATTPTVVQANSAERVNVPVIPLVIAVVVGVMVSVSAVSGVGYYLIRSGKVKLQTASAVQAASPAISTKTHAVVLEPMVVNLADDSTGAYLRVSMTLNVADPAEGPVKEEKSVNKEIDAALRDTVLTVLGRKTSESLLAADGKERLKKELRAALTEHNPEVKVTDLFITEFLVQR